MSEPDESPSPAYTPPALPGLKGLVAAVIGLGIIAASLAVLDVSLWVSAGHGLSSGTSEKLTLPDTLGDYTTVAPTVRHYDWERSRASYSAGYNAPAAVHEYTRTDGDNLGVTVLVVRAQLPSPPALDVRPGRRDSIRLADPAGNVSCVGYRVPAADGAGPSPAAGVGGDRSSEPERDGGAEDGDGTGDDGDDERESTREVAEHCVKSTPLLSVELLPDHGMPADEAGELIETVWNEVKA